MKKHPRSSGLFIFLGILWLSSLACRLGEVGTVVPSPAPPTLPPFETYTAVPPPVVVSVNEPEIESTEAVQAVPVMTAKVDLNVRRGPSTLYPILTALHAGESADIIGRNPDGFWWKIVCPQPYGGECWSSAREQYSTAVNAQSVPVAAVPPLPTETPTSTPTPTSTSTFTPTPTMTNTPSPTPTWTPTLTLPPLSTPYP